MKDQSERKLRVLRVRLRKVIIGIEMNRLVRLHPESDQVLRRLGIRVRHAIFYPQLIIQVSQMKKF